MATTFPWPRAEAKEVRTCGRFLLHLWRKEVSDFERVVRLTNAEAVVFRTLAATNGAVSLKELRKALDDYFGFENDKPNYKRERQQVRLLGKKIKCLEKDKPIICCTLAKNKYEESSFLLDCS